MNRGLCNTKHKVTHIAENIFRFLIGPKMKYFLWSPQVACPYHFLIHLFQGRLWKLSSGKMQLMFLLINQNLWAVDFVRIIEGTNDLNDIY